MKKILLFILVLFCFLNGYSQPVVNRAGPANTVSDYRLQAAYNFFVPRYADTTTANTFKGIDSCGAVIFTYDSNKLWFRQCSPKKWIIVGSASGGGVNIYNSDGTITGTRVVELSTYPLSFVRNTYKQIAAEDNLTTLGSPNNIRRFTIYDDSVTLTGSDQSASSADSVLVRTASGRIKTRAQSEIGGVTSLTNGLTLAATVGKLGGALTENTIIGNYGFDLTTRVDSFIMSGIALQLDTVDFNIKGDSLQYLFNVNTNTNKIGIGTNNPYSFISNITTQMTDGSNGVSNDGIQFSMSNGGYMVGFENTSSGGTAYGALIKTEGTERLLNVVNASSISVLRADRDSLVTGLTISNDDSTKKLAYTAWVLKEIAERSGATPTWQQTLTAGSTLTVNNDIDINGTDLSFVDNVGGSTFSVTMQGISTIGFDVINSGDAQTNVSIIKDSIQIRPHKGQINIDTLRSWSGISDTTYKKVMTWDTRNGRWEYSNWFGSGGGSGVTSIGTINSQTKAANGAVISGTSLVMQTVDATYPGLMTSADKLRLDSTSYLTIDKTYDSLAWGRNDSVFLVKSLRVQVNGSTVTPTTTDSTVSYNLTSLTTSLTNGLTLSSGVGKLGGALTENTNITNATGYTFKLHLDEDDSDVGLIGDTYNSLIGFQNGNIAIYQNGGATTLSITSTYAGLQAASGGYNTELLVYRDKVQINPHLGSLFIDTLQSAVGTKALRYNPTTGLVSYADTTAGGGGVSWSSIINPTTTLSLTFDDAETTTFTNSSNTETFWTVTSNSLTTGTVESLTSSSLTSGNLVSLTSTSTALASGNELLNLVMSGANGTSTITATPLRISVTNTGTSSTNIGLDITSSGASTNYSIYGTGDIAYFRPSSGSGTGYMRFASTTGSDHSIQYDNTQMFIRGASTLLLGDWGTGIAMQFYNQRVFVGPGGGTGDGRLQVSAGTTTVPPFVLTTGTSTSTTKAGALEYTTPQLFFTNGALVRQEIPQIQQSRVSTQFDATSTTTLANITGLTANVAAGKTYRFEAKLYTTSNSSGGVKAAIGGTATATAIIYEGLTIDAGLITQSRGTALATAVGAVTAVTAGYIIITGTITVNAAGTLTVQFAQNASNGTASSVLVGSTFVLTEML